MAEEKISPKVNVNPNNATVDSEVNSSIKWPPRGGVTIRRVRCTMWCSTPLDRVIPFPPRTNFSSDVPFSTDSEEVI
ncbi:hypothetical protein TNCV_4829031 [Trichonephila clavipes]|nr:hypothetical protein TNCV_4829031 [Trichonephila clavipes]